MGIPKNPGGGGVEGGVDMLSERVRMMRDSLQKSRSITENVVNILGSFDHHLSALETAMRPTQRLAKKDNSSKQTKSLQMKSILLFIFLAIFLPLSVLATCTTDTPGNQGLREYVLDINHNPVNTSSRYFIVPAHYTMKGGGLRLADLGDQPQHICPTSVVQSEAVTDDGIVVYFGPLDPNEQKILRFTPLNIRFYVDNILCDNLTVWKVDNFDKPVSLRLQTISTGAKPRDPTDLSSWFRIEPFNSDYKIVFCLHGNCHNIGFVDQSGYTRLVLSKDPMVFNFKVDPFIGKAEA
ncbi:hypothetical protein HAX54_031614 [Datura stramonium]|uniref:Miraculin-like n=1 Tax=Datura stramonium TaxID=4076 RepID=A0ABS8SC04_DATST|nr:hypothetical protein [Datura stramonium]